MKIREQFRRRLQNKLRQQDTKAKPEVAIESQVDRATLKQQEPEETLAGKIYELGSTMLATTVTLGVGALGAAGGALGVIAAAPALFATGVVGLGIGAFADFIDHHDNGSGRGEPPVVMAPVGALVGTGIGALAMYAASSGGIAGALIAIGGGAVSAGVLTLLQDQ